MDIARIGPAPIPPTATPFLVPMRDGVHLAADVYLPEGDTTPGPAILIRLPYDKDGEYTYIPQIAAYMTRRGYRVVAQDVRGKFRSEGETRLFVHEAEDGHDTIDWVSRQPWCDGRVAMWGDSYYGYTQWAAASLPHPALKAIAPRLTGTRLGEPSLDRPGEPTRDVEMAITYLYPLTHFHSRDTYEWDVDWTRRPYLASIEAFLAAVGQRSISFDQWYPDPVLLPRFPLPSVYDAPAIPTLHTIAWWDNVAPLSWQDQREIGRRPDWDATTWLVIEAMDHESYRLDEPHRVAERTPEQIEAILPWMLDPALEFFDTVVRGLAPLDAIPRVRWRLAHAGGYRTADAWPPAGVVESALHATADGRLVPTPEPPATTTMEWVHDPDDLVPSSVPNPFAYLLDLPDEAPLARRADVLAWVAEPVAADLDLVGGVEVTAVLASSGPRMDVHLRLLDLAPDGTGTRITRGRLHLVDASAPQRVVVDCYEVGYRLRAGHRLALHLASSDFPEFLPQPGTGEDPWTAVEVAPNTQRVLVGGDDGLALRFHTLPGGSE